MGIRFLFCRSAGDPPCFPAAGRVAVHILAPCGRRCMGKLPRSANIAPRGSDRARRGPLLTAWRLLFSWHTARAQLDPPPCKCSGESGTSLGVRLNVAVPPEPGVPKGKREKRTYPPEAHPGSAAGRVAVLGVHRTSCCRGQSSGTSPQTTHRTPNESERNRTAGGGVHLGPFFGRRCIATHRAPLPGFPAAGRAMMYILAPCGRRCMGSCTAPWAA